MAAPTTQAEANTQAIETTLRGAVNQLTAAGGQSMTPAQATAAVTADDWTVATGSYNSYVYDLANTDTTWADLFANAPTNVNPPVFYNHSHLKAPVGGGWAEDQYS
jgi:hypothetical protein